MSTKKRTFHTSVEFSLSNNSRSHDLIAFLINFSFDFIIQVVNLQQPLQVIFWNIQYSCLWHSHFSARMKTTSERRCHQVFISEKQDRSLYSGKSFPSMQNRKYSCSCTAHCFSICETQCLLCSDNTASTHHVIKKNKVHYGSKQSKKLTVQVTNWFVQESLLRAG